MSKKSPPTCPRTDQQVLALLKENLEFCRERNRKATFKSWVFKDQAKCSAGKLAEAGFVFEGSRFEPDAVRCFLCNKHLDSWDEDDDPWSEHRKHSSNCKFANLDKPEKSQTFSEFMDIRNEFIESFVRKVLMEELEQLQADINDIITLQKSWDKF